MLILVNYKNAMCFSAARSLQGRRFREGKHSVRRPAHWQSGGTPVASLLSSVSLTPRQLSQNKNSVRK